MVILYSGVYCSVVLFYLSVKCKLVPLKEAPFCENCYFLMVTISIRTTIVCLPFFCCIMSIPQPLYGIPKVVEFMLFYYDFNALLCISSFDGRFFFALEHFNKLFKPSEFTSF